MTNTTPRKTTNPRTATNLGKTIRPRKTTHKLRSGSKPTLPQLVKRADAAFSRYVRLRDAEYTGGQWVGQCISCQRKLVVIDRDGHWNPAVNAGHYISRGRKVLRWDDCNVNSQCAHCNAWQDKVKMLRDYRRNLCLKIGENAVSDLEAQAVMLHKPTRDELLEIITDAKAYVSFTLAHPTGLPSGTTGLVY